VYCDAVAAMVKQYALPDCAILSVCGDIITKVQHTIRFDLASFLLLFFPLPSLYLCLYVCCVRVADK
jgi:hypothetical protein